MVLELGLLEQRHKAVLKVLNGATVADVACPSGVAHQMPSDVEARVGAIRREHPRARALTFAIRQAREIAGQDLRALGHADVVAGRGG